jgi:hypothetical protein
MNTDEHGWPEASAQSDQLVERADPTPCRRSDVPLITTRFVGSLLAAIKRRLKSSVFIRVHPWLILMNNAD